MPAPPAEHLQPFPATRVSVLTRLRDGEASVRDEAFGMLVRAYWQPVYTYLRLHWRAEPQDAEDLTQGFLAAAWQKEFFAGYDVSRARFRTFLRTCLDRHVQNQRKADRALKRGGGAHVLALDFASAETELRGREVADPADTEAFFQQEFVRELFASAVGQLRAELEGRGRGLVFAIFDRYDLGPAEGTTYAEIAREFDLPVTQVTNHLHAARRRFREIVLGRLRELSGSEEEFREDARAILGVALR